MKRIVLGPGFEVPLDVVTQKIAFLARSGAGKTYAAGVMVEQLMEARAQVVVVDPVGVWYGLRLAADGKKPGIPIYVLGGLHKDVQLEPTGGELVAGVVVESGISVVLDVSEMTGGEQRRFVRDFATSLLHRKKQRRSALMVVWEECQDFVPQRVMGDSAQMVGAMERLIKQGRNFGIGTTLISQRPQAVNKDVLNQTECLVVMQTTGPQERKAIQGWVVEKAADVADAVDKLPSLKRGEAFVWSPAWLEAFKRVHIGKKQTFDASRTPEFGELELTQNLAPVDLKALEKAMAGTIERSKAQDPGALRQRIAQLEAEATKRQPKVEVKEVPLIRPPEARRLSLVMLRLEKLVSKLSEVSLIASNMAADLKATTERAVARSVHPVEPPTPALKPINKFGPLVPVAGDKTLAGPERKLLVVLGQYGPRTLKQLAIQAGYAMGGGAFRNPLGALRSKGFISGGRGEQVTITVEGGLALGNYDRLPTGAALRAHWYASLRGPERKILKAVVEAYPSSIPITDLAERTGYAAGGGAFRNPLGRLRTLQLVSGQGSVRADDALF